MFYKKTWKLDPTRFRTSSGADQRTFSALGAQISDAERFRDATRFRWHLPGPTCLFYKRTGSYHDMLIVLSLKISILLITGTAGPVCSKPISPGKPDWRFIEVLRGFDDSTCNYSTRMMGVYGRRCLRPGCIGRVAFKVAQYTFTHSGTTTKILPGRYSTIQSATSILSLTAIKPSAPSKILSHVVCTIRFVYAFKVSNCGMFLMGC